MKRTKTKPASLTSLIEALGESLTSQSAKRILAIKADKKLQARVKYLGECSNGGYLSAEEHAEYAEIVRFDTMISILQSKARSVLVTLGGKSSSQLPRNRI